MKYHRIKTFCKRLDKIGIKIIIADHHPWMYLHSINGVKIAKNVRYNDGWCIFVYVYMSPMGQHGSGYYKMTDRRKTFELIRGYVG